MYTSYTSIHTCILHTTIPQIMKTNNNKNDVIVRSKKARVTLTKNMNGPSTQCSHIHFGKSAALNSSI